MAFLFVGNAQPRPPMPPPPHEVRPPRPRSRYNWHCREVTGDGMVVAGFGPLADGGGKAAPARTSGQRFIGWTALSPSGAKQPAKAQTGCLPKYHLLSVSHPTTWAGRKHALATDRVGRGRFRCLSRGAGACQRLGRRLGVVLDNRVCRCVLDGLHRKGGAVYRNVYRLGRAALAQRRARPAVCIAAAKPGSGAVRASPDAARRADTGAAIGCDGVAVAPNRTRRCSFNRTAGRDRRSR